MTVVPNEATMKEVPGVGCGFSGAAARWIRPAGADVAGVAAAVNVQNVIGAVLALALIAYLFVALIRPEKF